MQRNAANNSVYFATVRANDIPAGYTLASEVYFMIGWKYRNEGTNGYGVQMFFPYYATDVFIRQYRANEVIWRKIATTYVN